MRILKTSLISIVTFFMLLQISFMQSKAYENKDNGSCVLDIPITVSDKNNNIPGDVNITVEMTSDGDPSQSYNSQITVKPKGTYNFSVTYDTPGNYEYKIKEIGSDNNSVILDNSVYKISVCVVYNNNGNLSAAYASQKIGADAKSSVGFVNRIDSYTGGESDSSVVSSESSSDILDNSEDSESSSKPSDDSIEEDSSSGYDDDSTSVSTPDSLDSIDSTASSVPDGDRPYTGSAVTLGISTTAVLSLIIFAVLRRRKDEKDGE